MQNIPTKNTGDSLTAVEFNQIPDELEKAITDTGITLSISDLSQLSKAIANYVAAGDFYTDTGAADAYVLDTIGSKQGPTLYAVGARFRFIVGNSNTGAAATANANAIGVLSIKTNAGTNPSPGDLTAGQIVELEYDGTDLILKSSIAAPRGYIDGVALSTTGASATMSISAGEATDSANASVIRLASGINGKTTAGWAVGVGGGLDVGAIANNTWYHFYLIKRVDTGVVDVVFSLSAISPALPANYTLYRYIGSGLTDGSAQWRKFNQNGDKFIWDVPDATNYSTAVLTTTAVTVTLTPTPLGLSTDVILTGLVSQASATNALLLSDLAQTDSAPSNARHTTIVPSNAGYGSVNAEIRTNTASQIRARASGANTTVSLSVLGYINTRGKDV